MSKKRPAGNTHAYQAIGAIKSNPRVNGLSLPEGAAPPEHGLEYYKRLELPNASGQGE